MHASSKIEDLIGSTPLVDLSALAGGAATILGKCESANPGGSAKDRIARAMLDAAERDGSLRPGGTVIEPTSGNTGVGLAMLCAARGYQMTLVMPETMSVERRRLAAAYGAKIVLTPGDKGMSGAVERAEELCRETPGSIVAGQFTNPANPQAHYETTGPEIWADTDGAVDILVAGVGTGGTISGAARFLKEKSGAVAAVAVEPAESAGRRRGHARRDRGRLPDEGPPRERARPARGHLVGSRGGRCRRACRPRRERGQDHRVHPARHRRALPLGEGMTTLAAERPLGNAADDEREAR